MPLSTVPTPRAMLRLIRAAIGLVLCLTCLPGAHAASSRLLCFYSPETNINNYASLKTEFDIYLAGFGPYRLQPFSDRHIFTSFVKKGGSNIFLMPSSYYRKARNESAVQAVLVGVSGGSSFVRQTISSKRGIRSLKALAGKTIATADSEAYAIELLGKIFGSDQRKLIDSIRILEVPKDIDALMAVTFGMASAALTSDRSVTLLKSINIKQYKMLVGLGESGNILLPVVAEPRQHDKQGTTLIRTLERMGKSPAGRKRLNLLGLDGFKRLDPSEKRMLAQ